jgi:hypothetical protein
MTRLAITLAFLASCSGTARRGTTSGSTTGSGEGPSVIAKQVALSWGIEKHGEVADIFLATTDETGKQISHPLGRYQGECTVIAPAREMNAITGVACRTDGTGTELHAVVQRGVDVVVLKLGIAPGVAPDPMAREEVMRVTVPLGAKIAAGT